MILNGIGGSKSDQHDDFWIDLNVRIWRDWSSERRSSSWQWVRMTGADWWLGRMDGWVDEPPFRWRGLGKKSVRLFVSFCRSLRRARHNQITRMPLFQLRPHQTRRTHTHHTRSKPHFDFFARASSVRQKRDNAFVLHTFCNLPIFILQKHGLAAVLLSHVFLSRGKAYEIHLLFAYQKICIENG